MGTVDATFLLVCFNSGLVPSGLLAFIDFSISLFNKIKVRFFFGFLNVLKTLYNFFKCSKK